MGVETLVSLIVMLLILGAAYLIVRLLVPALGLPTVIVKVAAVVIVVIAVIWLLQLLPGVMPKVSVD